MKFFTLFAIATLCAVATSCTLDKTDFESEIERDVTEYFEFKEAASLSNGNYRISIEALNGTFYKGYNEIRVKVLDGNNQVSSVSEFTFLPVFTDSENSVKSGPHRHQLEYNSAGNYFSGYVVFPYLTNPMEHWELYLNFNHNGHSYSIHQPITVQNQTNQNLNMTTFVGNDGEQYVIALVAPQKPKVAENQLVAGIYKYNRPAQPPGTFPDPAQFSYSEATDYKLLLDPRMPEPSMGNHSSPNNVDLTQQSDGLFYGVVNYTMTGNWTLNFRLMDSEGNLVKGTEVPTDFTPGIEGVKSELFIDILF